MNVAYFDCFSGISGDMCLGALVSAGWPAAELQRLPGRLGLADVRVDVSETRRGPFVATRVTVEVSGKQPQRHLREVASVLDHATFEPSVREQAHRVFERLAVAEAEVHGSTRERVHFHEVGAADALVDIVGTLEGLRSLSISEVYSSPLRLGRGVVRSEHGMIPVPAPATAVLLRGVPVEMPDIEAELVTPTGAALITTLVHTWGGSPSFVVGRVGVGAGQRDLREQPNVLRVLLGERSNVAAGGAGALRRGRVAVLETSLDDENPQFVAALVPRLLEQGALDAMVVPTVMKKGRPGLCVTVVAEPRHADLLAMLLLRETSTLGVRLRWDERYELERRSLEVETRFGRIVVKVADVPGMGERARPEFESVRAAAERAGRPLGEVAEAALEAWRQGERGAGRTP